MAFKVPEWLKGLFEKGNCYLALYLGNYNTTDVKHTLCDKLQPHAVHPNKSIKRFLFS